MPGARQRPFENENSVGLIAAWRQSAIAEAEGRLRAPNVEVGGGSSRATVVGTDDDGLLVALRGMRMSLAWRRIRPPLFLSLARKYVTLDADAVGALTRYCVVNDLLDEAEALAMEIPAADPAAREAARPVLDYIQAERRRRAAREARDAAAEAPAASP